MSVEYWLLKKQLGGWTKVSWWDESERDKASASYHSMVEAKGYAIRLVKVEVLNEHLLDEMLPEPRQEVEIPKEPEIKRGATWGQSWDQPTPSSKNFISNNPKPNTGWSGPACPKPVNPGSPHSPVWGNPIVNVDEVLNNTVNSSHGMTGKVWLGNPVTKEKKRVDPNDVAAMMADGWIKSGPRSVL